MPNFTFNARDERGQSLSGVITADNATLVMQQLRAEGKYPISIERAGATQTASEARIASGNSRRHPHSSGDAGISRYDSVQA